jgi:lipoprotein-anchoring transpeptidase ErfK/SrfK/LysM repeat protein
VPANGKARRRTLNALHACAKKEITVMNRLRRICVLLLLVSSWTISLLGMAYPARAQAPDGPGNRSDIHRVEAGETLNLIARQYGTDVKTLLQLNGLEDADLVYVGQQLVVAGGSEQNQPVRQGEERRDASENAPSYQVQDGDAPQRPGVAGEPQPQERSNADGSSVSWSNPDGSPVDFEPEGSERPSEANEAQVRERPDDSWSSPNNGPDDGDVDWEPQRPQRPCQACEAPYQEGADSARQQRDSGGPSVAWSSPDDDEVSWEVDDSRGQGVAWETQPAQRNTNAGENNGREVYAQEGASWETAATGEKWIDIDISDQQLIAYQGDTVIRVFSVSTGATKTPTVQGSFRTYVKIEVQDMSGGSVAAGDYYYQADVPWVQYFYEDYSIHGAYWHNMFGQRTGHGCVNMRVEEARWLYDWAQTGTRVEVHE